MNSHQTPSFSPGIRLRRAGALFATLAVLWFAWSGKTYPLLLSLGVVSCAGVTALCLRMRLADPERAVVPVSLRILGYTPYLLREVLRSNLEVARQILDPEFRPNPVVVRITAEPRTELGTTILANSITLTPGTLTVEENDGVILVHALTADAARALVDGEMNRRTAALEVNVPCNRAS